MAVILLSLPLPASRTNVAPWPKNSPSWVSRPASAGRSKATTTHSAVEAGAPLTRKCQRVNSCDAGRVSFLHGAPEFYEVYQRAIAAIGTLSGDRSRVALFFDRPRYLTLLREATLSYQYVVLVNKQSRLTTDLTSHTRGSCPQGAGTRSHPCLGVQRTASSQPHIMGNATMA